MNYQTFQVSRERQFVELRSRTAFADLEVFTDSQRFPVSTLFTL
jgi:hypothetical protein